MCMSFFVTRNTGRVHYIMTSRKWARPRPPATMALSKSDVGTNHAHPIGEKVSFHKTDLRRLGEHVNAETGYGSPQ